VARPRPAPTKLLVCAALLCLGPATARAVPLFGTHARGSDLDLTGTLTDGGPGSSSASVLGPTFQTQAGLGGSTFTPVLRAESVSTNAQNTDDFTISEAEAYQTFTSSIAQTITLDLTLHGVVTQEGTLLSNSYVLADIRVIGGSGFGLSDTYCSGQYAFGVYLCGSTLGSSNLYIPDGDLTLLDSISFDVAAGEQFGIYGILRANSRDGSSDAFDTLQMSFEDDTYIEAAAVPEPSTAFLCGAGLIAVGLTARHGTRRRTRSHPAEALGAQ
jgi:hypothetical protein